MVAIRQSIVGVAIRVNIPGAAHVRRAGRRRGRAAARRGHAALHPRELHQRALRRPRRRHAAGAGRAHDRETHLCFT